MLRRTGPRNHSSQSVFFVRFCVVPNWHVIQMLLGAMSLAIVNIELTSSLGDSEYSLLEKRNFLYHPSSHYIFTTIPIFYRDKSMILSPLLSELLSMTH